MNRCLREDTLLMLHHGDGTEAERAHLRSCRACDTRYARLTDDLQLISRVLSEAPSPRTSVARLAPRGLPPGLHWMPAAVALVGMLALTMAVTRFSSPSPVQVAAATASVSVFAEDVSAALFAVPNEPVLAAAPSDAAHLEAALAGGWPCTREQLFNGECDDQLTVELLESD